MAAFETGGEQPDLAARLAQWLGSTTELVRSRTVAPAQFLARVVVYGLLIAIVGSVVTVLAVDALVKLLEAYLFANRVWITEFIVAGLALLGSSLAWRRMGQARRRLSA
jgi:hypothetical protein